MVSGTEGLVNATVPCFVFSIAQAHCVCWDRSLGCLEHLLLEWEDGPDAASLSLAPGHHSTGYWGSISCMFLHACERWVQPREVLSAWHLLHFQSVSFLLMCQLLTLVFSIQGPLITTKRNVQCSCGSTWALPASTLKSAPSVGSVFAGPVVAVVSGILNTCMPASWAFPQPPSLPSILHLKCSCSGPIKGSQMDRTSPCLVSLPSWTKSEAPLCEAFCCSSLCLNEPHLQENFFFNKIK